jgi:thiopurine S-methyltransferase
MRHGPRFLDRLLGTGRIRFHGHAVNPLLVDHFARLNLTPGARVFLPLCGKSVDIGWLRARGFRVAGAELSPLAVEQLFDQMGEAPEITLHGPLRRFRARDLDIFEGDIFDLTPDRLGPVAAVHDRAALIALPAAMRARYAAHLVALTGAAPQLLSSYTAPGEPDDGPPFPVDEAEIRSLCRASHRVTLAWEGLDEPSGETDQVWLLGRP